jgi:hypothetical protein
MCTQCVHMQVSHSQFLHVLAGEKAADSSIINDSSGVVSGSTGAQDQSDAAALSLLQLLVCMMQFIGPAAAAESR